MHILSLFRGMGAFLAAGLLAVSPVQSGDFAKMESFGFSDEGYHFAFEQYGIQDGSRAPYSDIFIIDVRSDSWVFGSPFRLRGQQADFPDPIQDLYDLRQKNQQAARNALSNSRVSGEGRTVGHNPVTEIGADPHQLSVYPRMVVPPIDNTLVFSIEEFPLPSSECASYGADTKGFRLTLEHEGQARTLNEDKKLPKSRGCPLRYRIERVETYYPAGRPPVFAAIVLMETHGFEGPDGRYLAITGQF